MDQIEIKPQRGLDLDYIWGLQYLDCRILVLKCKDFSRAKNTFVTFRSLRKCQFEKIESVILGSD